MKEQVITILRGINPKAADMQDGHLIEDGILDSFDLVDLVQALEDTFEIEIDAKHILPRYFQNVDTICALVAEIQGN